MAAGFSETEWSERESKEDNAVPFSFGSDMPYSCHILLVTHTIPDTMWEGNYSKVWIPRSGGSLGAILKLATICLHWIISLGMQNTAVLHYEKGRGIYFCYVLWQEPWFHTEFQQHYFFLFLLIACHFLGSRHETMREAGQETHPRGRCYSEPPFLWAWGFV